MHLWYGLLLLAGSAWSLCVDASCTEKAAAKPHQPGTKPMQFKLYHIGHLLLQPWLELMQDMVHVVVLLLSDTVSACRL